jgi:hypothetical protein
MKRLLATAAFVAVAVILFAVTARAASPCKPSDFEIKQLELREIFAGAALIVGEVVSHCTTPASAVLRTTLRTSDGRVVAVGQLYIGASTFGNIGPGESAPFNQEVYGVPDGLAVSDLKMEGKIVDVHRW